jgi:hypothetical protein
MLVHLFYLATKAKACYRTCLLIEAHFTHKCEGLKISSILGQTVGGWALIFTTSSMAVDPLNVTTLLPSNKTSTGGLPTSQSTYKDPFTDNLPTPSPKPPIPGS